MLKSSGRRYLGDDNYSRRTSARRQQSLGVVNAANDEAHVH